MGRPRYRLLAHTADARVAVWGADVGEFLDNLVRAVVRVVMGRAIDVPPTHRVPVGEWPADLPGQIVRLANETVFQLLVDRRAGTGLCWSATGPELEVAQLPPGSAPELEVKAATYHDLRPRRRGGRLSAVLTLDL